MIADSRAAPMGPNGGMARLGGQLSMRPLMMRSTVWTALTERSLPPRIDRPATPPLEELLPD